MALCPCACTCTRVSHKLGIEGLLALGVRLSGPAPLATHKPRVANGRVGHGTLRWRPGLTRGGRDHSSLLGTK